MNKIILLAAFLLTPASAFAASRILQVPEPSTLLLIIGGLGGAALARRRRK